MDLEASNLTVVIDDREIVRHESLVCRAGTMTALVGPSGSGKTTLLHCLGLLQRPTSGRVLVDGVDTSGWSGGRRRRLWRDHAAFVLQDYGVMEDESVAYNVTMSASLFGQKLRGDRKRLAAALEETGLSGRDEEPSSHLSGGEKQRLAVARAIYKQARLILIDEPTASLDAANRALVIGLFAARAREGCTVVVATHDSEMMAACDLQHSLGRAPTDSNPDHVQPAPFQEQPS